MSAQTIGVRLHPLVRIRYQLLGGLTVAIFLPAMIRMSVDPRVILSWNMQVTMMAAMIAHVTGYFVYRRIGNFPGIASAGHILPTFALTYGTVFLIIFFFRLDYSRFQAAGSFAASTMWYFALSVATRRLHSYSLAVVPGGDVDRLSQIGGVVWQHLARPGSVVNRVNGVVADLRSDLSQEWQGFIADSALNGIPVYHVKQITESLTGRVEIEHLSENMLGSLNPNHAFLKIKQVVDWVSALLALVLLLPVWALVALAIKLDTPGPVLFCQERMGYRGRVFSVCKFRTMFWQEGFCSSREDAMTRPHDSRITRVGRFLRRTRLDELPQIINILRGEMSWIGPRPEAAVLSRWYEAELPFYRYRHIVRPGISGWAQVNQGHVFEKDEVLGKLHFDFYYIKNFSPWLDVVIVLRTIRTVLTGFGAR
ncbi:sugar transferase [Mesorhizobium sp. 10J20-29]